MTPREVLATAYIDPSRDRRLTDVEIREILNALDAYGYVIVRKSLMEDMMADYLLAKNKLHR